MAAWGASFAGVDGGMVQMLGKTKRQFTQTSHGQSQVLQKSLSSMPHAA